MKIEIIIPLFVYLLLIYLLAFFCKYKEKKSNNFLEEYFIGSRKMGGFVLAMTLVATYISASSFIGGPGVAYKIGLGWVLLAVIQLPTAWLTLGVLGKKFAIIARKINAVTINDFLWARYKSRAVVILASTSIILFFIAAMVAQFVGGARLFEALTGLSYETGLCIFASTVILYTTVGGFRAVVLTDAVQGILMIIGTLALFLGIIPKAGDHRPRTDFPDRSKRFFGKTVYSFVLGFGLLRRNRPAANCRSLLRLQRQPRHAQRHCHRHIRAGIYHFGNAPLRSARARDFTRFNRAGYDYAPNQPQSFTAVCCRHFFGRTAGCNYVNH